METNRLLTANQVAQILGVSRSKSYKLMRQRVIPTIVLGKNVRVRVEDLEPFINSHREVNDSGDHE